MIVRFGAFALDSDRRQVTRGDVEIHLTPKAFDLLTVLIDDAPRVVRKTELHEQLWPGTFVSDAALVGLVKEVRRALDDRDPRTPIIRTAHGVGYACVAPIDREAARRIPVSRWIVTGGRRIALADGENVIGREPAAAILLDVAGVSRRHARIVVSERGAILEDLGSKNGTRIGDTLVTGTVALHDGDAIHVGPVPIIYHAAASGISTDTVPFPVRIVASLGCVILAAFPHNGTHARHPPWRLRSACVARQRRDGRGLPCPRYSVGSHRRAQGSSRCPRRRPRPSAAIGPRSPRDLEPESPAHLHALRHRPSGWRRLSGDGVSWRGRRWPSASRRARFHSIRPCSTRFSSPTHSTWPTDAGSSIEM